MTIRRSVFLLFLFSLGVLGNLRPQAAEKSPQGFDADIWVNGGKQGVTRVEIPPQGDNYRFAGPSILPAAIGLLPPAAQEALQESLGEKLKSAGYLSRDDLRQCGVHAALMENLAQVHLEYRPWDIGAEEDTAAKAEAELPDTLDLDYVSVKVDTNAAALNKVLDQSSEAAPKQAEAVDTAVDKTGRTVTFSPTDTREDLFRKLFKKEAPKTPDRMDVALKIEGQAWGNVLVKVSPEKPRYLIPLDTLLAAVEEKVVPEVIESLRRGADTQGMVSGDAIRNAGLIETFRMDLFELDVTIPSPLIPMQKHSISSQWNALPPGDYLRPNTFSMFLNTRLLQRIQYNELSPNADLDPVLSKGVVDNMNRDFRKPLSLDFDGAMNLKGVVLEGQATFLEPTEGKDPYLQRKEMRFVYDQPAAATRFYAGDLLFPTFGYQSFLKLGGFGASRDFSLQPHLIAYPTKEYEFYLENQAEVKVYINGSLVKTLVLSPGAHDLQGFPLASGESDVKIEILDVTGRTQTVEFTFIHEVSLLARGRSAFSYNVGYVSTPDVRLRDWDLADTAFYFWGYGYDRTRLGSSLAYQRGITDVLTGALYSQTLDQDGLVGLQLRYAMPIGRVEADLAMSRSDSSGSDFAVKAAYTLFPKIRGGKAKPFALRFQGEYRGEEFTYINNLAQVHSDAWIFTAGLTSQLGFMSADLNGGYTVKRGEHDIYNASLNLRKQLIRNLSSNLNVNHYFSVEGYSNTTLSAAIQYQFVAGPNNLMVNHRALNNPVRTAGTTADSARRWDNYTDLSWDFNSGSPFPSNPSASANISVGAASNDYGARLGLRGNQGFLSLSGRRAEPALGQGNFIQNNLDINAQTALVMVDGEAAISRPVTNSFVMAQGIKSMETSEVLINPYDGGYGATSDFLGPAVLPSLSPYMPANIQVNPVDPPVGAVVQKSRFTVVPGYKSGFLINIGTDGDVVATGTLLDAAGKPVTFLMLNVYPELDPKAAPTTGFTNAAGRFQLPAMTYGKWRLEAPGLGTARFEIPMKAAGIYQLGEIRIEAGP